MYYLVKDQVQWNRSYDYNSSVVQTNSYFIIQHNEYVNDLVVHLLLVYEGKVVFSDKVYVIGVDSSQYGEYTYHLEHIKLEQRMAHD